MIKYPIILGVVKKVGRSDVSAINAREYSYVFYICSFAHNLSSASCHNLRDQNANTIIDIIYRSYDVVLCLIAGTKSR